MLENAAYVFGGLLFGWMNATREGFTGAELVGASIAQPVLGALIGWIYRFFRPTRVARWAFWWSMVALIIQSANMAQRAR